jgi:hypothetical protein
MEKQCTTKGRALSPTLTGRRLAVDMLKELGASNADDACIEPRYRAGREQNNIFARHLRAVIDQSDPAVLGAFCAVVTDYFTEAAGAVDDPEYYNTLDEHGNERGFCLGVTALVPSGRATAPRRRRRVTVPKLRAVR